MTPSPELSLEKAIAVLRIDYGYRPILNRVRSNEEMLYLLDCLIEDKFDGYDDFQYWCHLKNIEADE
jgi:hypothetical protein